MRTTDEPTTSRRVFLKRSSAALAMIPVVNLFGCSDDGSQDPASSTPEQSPAEAPRPPAEAPAGGAPAGGSAADQQAPAEQPGQASAASQGGSELVKLEESNAQAQALGYRHDSSQVDSSAYPRHQPEQVCANCTLYQADAGGEPGWGGCSIFPGKLVDAQGWCSAYVAAS